MRFARELERSRLLPDRAPRSARDRQPPHLRHVPSTARSTSTTSASAGSGSRHSEAPSAGSTRSSPNGRCARTTAASSRRSNRWAYGCRGSARAEASDGTTRICCSSDSDRPSGGRRARADAEVTRTGARRSSAATRVDPRIDVVLYLVRDRSLGAGDRALAPPKTGISSLVHVQMAALAPHPARPPPNAPRGGRRSAVATPRGRAVTVLAAPRRPPYWTLVALPVLLWLPFTVGRRRADRRFAGEGRDRPRARCRGARRRARRARAADGRRSRSGSTSAAREVLLSDRQLAAHGLILGASGAGKSTTLLADPRRPDRARAAGGRDRPQGLARIRAPSSSARPDSRGGRSASGRPTARATGTRSRTATRPSSRTS